MLSTLVREASSFSGDQLIERCIIGQSTENKRLCSALNGMSVLTLSPPGLRNIVEDKTECKSWRMGMDVTEYLLDTK